MNKASTVNQELPSLNYESIITNKKITKESIMEHDLNVDSLQSYLDALFGYYEQEGVANVEIQANNKSNSIDLRVDNAAGVTAPTANIQYRSMFETILAKFGLDLSDATFNEIICGDYYSVLARHGLIDHQPSNNVSFQGLGGVI